MTGFALTALALGIGATTGVFSVLNAVLWRSLPFRDPDRLVELQGNAMKDREGRFIASHTAFQDWLSASTFLSEAAFYSSGDVNLDLGGQSVRTKVAETSAGFFRALGAGPVLGRAFAADEDPSRPRRGRRDRLWAVAATFRRRSGGAVQNRDSERSVYDGDRHCAAVFKLPGQDGCLDAHRF